MAAAEQQAKGGRSSVIVASLKRECSLMNRMEAAPPMLLLSFFTYFLYAPVVTCWHVEVFLVHLPPAAYRVLSQDPGSAMIFLCRSILITVYNLAEILLEKASENAQESK